MSASVASMKTNIKLSPTSPKHQLMLAGQYFHGIGVERNLELARKWLVKAADNKLENEDSRLAKAILLNSSNPLDETSLLYYYNASLAIGEVLLSDVCNKEIGLRISGHSYRYNLKPPKHINLDKSQLSGTLIAPDRFLDVSDLSKLLKRLTPEHHNVLGPFAIFTNLNFKFDSLLSSAIAPIALTCSLVTKDSQNITKFFSVSKLDKYSFVGKFSNEHKILLGFKLLHDVAKGLAHLHKYKVIHGDVGFESIIIEFEDKAKIVTGEGNSPHPSPNEGTDIFDFGCTMLAFFTLLEDLGNLKEPIDPSTALVVQQKIKKGTKESRKVEMARISKGSQKQVVELIQDCLQVDTKSKAENSLSMEKISSRMGDIIAFAAKQEVFVNLLNALVAHNMDEFARTLKVNSVINPIFNMEEFNTWIQGIDQEHINEILPLSPLKKPTEITAEMPLINIVLSSLQLYRNEWIISKKEEIQKMMSLITDAFKDSKALNEDWEKFGHIYRAIQKQEVKEIEEFLSKGGDPLHKDIFGDFLISKTIRNNKMGIFRLLMTDAVKTFSSSPSCFDIINDIFSLILASNSNSDKDLFNYQKEMVNILFAALASNLSDETLKKLNLDHILKACYDPKRAHLINPVLQGARKIQEISKSISKDKFRSFSKECLNALLLKMVEHPEHLKTVKLILELGVDLNCQNENDNSLLQLAIRSQSSEIVKLLLDTGASIEDENGLILNLSITSNMPEITHRLLERGVKVWNKEYSIKTLNEANVNRLMNKPGANEAYLELLTTTLRESEKSKHFLETKEKIDMITDMITDKMSTMASIIAKVTTLGLSVPHFNTNGSISLDVQAFRKFPFYREVFGKRRPTINFTWDEFLAFRQRIRKMEESEGRAFAPDEIQLEFWNSLTLVKHFQEKRLKAPKEDRDLKERRDTLEGRFGKLEAVRSALVDAEIRFQVFEKECKEKRDKCISHLDKSEDILKKHDFKRPNKKKNYLKFNIDDRKIINEAYLSVLRAYRKAIKYKNRFAKKCNAWIQEIQEGIQNGDLDKAEMLINKLYKMPTQCLNFLNEIKTHYESIISKKLEKAEEQYKDVSYNANIRIQEEMKRKAEEEKEEKERLEEQARLEEQVRREKEAAIKFEQLQTVRLALWHNAKQKRAEERKKLKETKEPVEKKEIKEKIESVSEKSLILSSFEKEYRMPSRHTLGRITQLNRKIGICDALSQLELVILNAPKENKEIKENENDKIRILIDSHALLMSLARAMDNIKLMGGTTVIPQELARKFRNGIFHNPCLFSDLTQSSAILKKENADIRDMAIKICSYLRECHFNKQKPYENEWEVLQAIHSELFIHILEGELKGLNPDMKTCKEQMKRGGREFAQLMSYHDEYLKETPWTPIHNIFKIARDLTIARLGASYATYHDHYMQADDPKDARLYAKFRSFRGAGIVIRHENLKDKQNSSIGNFAL